MKQHFLIMFYIVVVYTNGYQHSNKLESII